MRPSFFVVVQESRNRKISSLSRALSERAFYRRAPKGNKREAVQAALLNSSGHTFATRVNAVRAKQAVA